MGEFVIYVVGAASGVPQNGDVARGVAFDNHIAERNIAALRQSGHSVLQVGDAEQGFTLAELAQAIRDYPYAQQVIIDAHGSAEKDLNTGQKFHSVMCRPATDDEDDHSHCHRAGEIFAVLAENGMGQPLNVFMLSCGAKHAYLESDALPLGSTIVAYTNLEDEVNPLPDSSSFSVPVVRARNFAEQLALNLQEGLSYKHSMMNITVCRADLPADCRSFFMLDQAFRESCAEPHEDLPPEFVRDMRARCAPYMSDKAFNGVLEVVQMHATYWTVGTVRMDDKGRFSGVRPYLQFALHEPNFLEQIRREGLMGHLVFTPIC